MCGVDIVMMIMVVMMMTIRMMMVAQMKEDANTIQDDGSQLGK